MHHLASKSFLLFILPLLSYIGVALILSPHISHAAGNTYYVEEGGNCSTITACIGRLSPGDILDIRGGTYNEELNQIVMPSGTSGSPITIRAHAGETVTIQNWGLMFFADSPPPAWIVIDGLRFTNGGPYFGAAGHTYGPDHVTLKNFEISGGESDGIDIGRATNLLLSNGKIHDNGGSKCRNSPSFGTSSYCHGIYLDNGNNNVIENLEIYNITGNAIKLCQDDNGWGCSGNIVRNNIVHDWSRTDDSGGSAVGIIFASGATDSVAYNNIIYGCNGKQDSNGNSLPAMQFWRGNNNAAYNNTIDVRGGNCSSGLEIEYGTNNKIRNNIILHDSNPIRDDGIGGPTIIDHNLTADPQFVNASAHDFHLQTSSPAKDAGASLPEVPCDFDGNARPAGAAYDIGAYEYGATPGAGCSKGSSGGGGGGPTPTPIPPPIITISAIPSSISVVGQGITLSWSVTNADSCTASGGWSGTQATAGNTRFTPSATTIYTLECQGPGGTGQGSATVTVGTASSCTRYTSGSSVPAGFGVPWDVQNPGVLLLNATCTSPTVLLKVGNQNASNVMYRVHSD